MRWKGSGTGLSQCATRVASILPSKPLRSRQVLLIVTTEVMDQTAKRQRAVTVEHSLAIELLRSQAGDEGNCLCAGLPEGDEHRVGIGRLELSFAMASPSRDASNGVEFIRGAAKAQLLAIDYQRRGRQPGRPPASRVARL